MKPFDRIKKYFSNSAAKRLTYFFILVFDLVVLALYSSSIFSLPSVFSKLIFRIDCFELILLCISCLYLFFKIFYSEQKITSKFVIKFFMTPRVLWRFWFRRNTFDSVARNNGFENGFKIFFENIVNKRNFLIYFFICLIFIASPLFFFRAPFELSSLWLIWVLFEFLIFCLFLNLLIREFLLKKKFEIYGSLFVLGLFFQICLINFLNLFIFNFFKVNEFVYIGAFKLLCYLVGSLNFAILISKCFFKKDIRQFGSKNAGATNMLRTFGVKSALLTFIFDFSKGFFSILVCNFILHSNLDNVDFELVHFYDLTCTIFLVMGHIFPLFFNFEGGKGVLVAFGALAATDWKIVVAILSIFILVVFFSKIVSLASICAACSFPLIYFFGYCIFAGIGYKMVINSLVAVFVSVCVVLSHKDNYKRLCSGTEPKVGMYKKT